ncbi:PLP-dependent aminotransferase family protein [Clostridium paraputrificum]|uniref:aminotransferase-like domain-containing protein n=1 Tax=Clostridium TaxID=1485 RepID=UPI003D34FBE4
MMFEFSERAKKAKASEIREILKLTELPEVISFAGGLPAPELFPVDQITEMVNKVLKEEPHKALQYTTTDGYNPLREGIIKQRMKPFGIEATLDNILITSGSQQAIDYLGKAFINEGDVIICESPSYLGAIQGFKQYGARFVEVEMDEEGIIIDELRMAIKANPSTKLIYTIPDYHNPTGRTMSLDRRKALADIAAEFKIPVIEDAPYGELVLEGEKLPYVKSFDEEGYVIFLGSFSKTFCPGFRIGWTCAHPEIIKKLIMIKQASDLQVSTFDQMIVGYFINNYDLNDHIKKIKAVYEVRKDAMLKAMERNFHESIKFTKSKGGLFTWVEVKESINTVNLLEEALKEDVAFVPGASFFPNGGYNNFFRLNYSNMPVDKIVEGIERLAKVINKYY